MAESNNNQRLWAGSDERNRDIDDIFDRFQLSIVFIILMVLVIVGAFIAWTVELPSPRLYWLRCVVCSLQ